uniref:EDRF1 N-terminal domain-containing protein n=1 Tax=Pinguiococcus pyrenoidosus TaxID=172671 RepID=A0A7R9YDJ3_9STRA
MGGTLLVDVGGPEDPENLPALAPQALFAQLLERDEDDNAEDASSFRLEPARFVPEAARPFRQLLDWQYHEMKLLVGTNLVTLPDGSGTRMHMLDLSRPMEICTCLDIYLDNVMANIPELALCMHAKGFLRGVTKMRTVDIPWMGTGDRSAQPIFSAADVDMTASALLRFLKSNCNREGGTYILHREAADEADDSQDDAKIRLYDVTALGMGSQRRWKWLLGMLCYRFAVRIAQHLKTPPNRSLDAKFVGTMMQRQRSLFQTAFDLLHQLRSEVQPHATGGAEAEPPPPDAAEAPLNRSSLAYPTITASICEEIANTYILAADGRFMGYQSNAGSDHKGGPREERKLQQKASSELPSPRPSPGGAGGAAGDARRNSVEHKAFPAAKDSEVKLDGDTALEDEEPAEEDAQSSGRKTRRRRKKKRKPSPETAAVDADRSQLRMAVAHLKQGVAILRPMLAKMRVGGTDAQRENLYGEAPSSESPSGASPSSPVSSFGTQTPTTSPPASPMQGDLRGTEHIPSDSRLSMSAVQGQHFELNSPEKGDGQEDGSAMQDAANAVSGQLQGIHHKLVTTCLRLFRQEMSRSAEDANPDRPNANGGCDGGGLQVASILSDAVARKSSGDGEDDTDKFAPSGPKDPSMPSLFEDLIATARDEGCGMKESREDINRLASVSTATAEMQLRTVVQSLAEVSELLYPQRGAPAPEPLSEGLPAATKDVEQASPPTTSPLSELAPKLRLARSLAALWTACGDTCRLTASSGGQSLASSLNLPRDVVKVLSMLADDIGQMAFAWADSIHSASDQVVPDDEEKEEDEDPGAHGRRNLSSEPYGAHAESAEGQLSQQLLRLLHVSYGLVGEFSARFQIETDGSLAHMLGLRDCPSTIELDKPVKRSEARLKDASIRHLLQMYPFLSNNESFLCLLTSWEESSKALVDALEGEPLLCAAKATVVALWQASGAKGTGDGERRAMYDLLDGEGDGTKIVHASVACAASICYEVAIYLCVACAGLSVLFEASSSDPADPLVALSVAAPRSDVRRSRRRVSYRALQRQAEYEAQAAMELGFGAGEVSKQTADSASLLLKRYGDACNHAGQLLSNLAKAGYLYGCKAFGGQPAEKAAGEPDGAPNEESTKVLELWMKAGRVSLFCMDVASQAEMFFLVAVQTFIYCGDRVNGALCLVNVSSVVKIGSFQIEVYMKYKEKAKLDTPEAALDAAGSKDQHALEKGLMHAIFQGQAAAELVKNDKMEREVLQVVHNEMALTWMALGTARRMDLYKDRFHSSSDGAVQASSSDGGEGKAAKATAGEATTERLESKDEEVQEIIARPHVTPEEEDHMASCFAEAAKLFAVIGDHWQIASVALQQGRLLRRIWNEGAHGDPTRMRLRLQTAISFLIVSIGGFDLYAVVRKDEPKPGAVAAPAAEAPKDGPDQSASSTRSSRRRKGQRAQSHDKAVSAKAEDAPVAPKKPVTLADILAPARDDYVPPVKQVRPLTASQLAMIVKVRCELADLIFSALAFVPNPNPRGSARADAEATGVDKRTIAVAQLSDEMNGPDLPGLLWPVVTLLGVPRAAPLLLTALEALFSGGFVFEATKPKPPYSEDARIPPATWLQLAKDTHKRVLRLLLALLTSLRLHQTAQASLARKSAEISEIKSLKGYGPMQIVQSTVAVKACKEMYKIMLGVSGSELGSGIENMGYALEQCEAIRSGAGWG